MPPRHQTRQGQPDPPRGPAAIGLSASKARMASHGSNGGIRPAVVQLQVTGGPSVTPKPPKPAKQRFGVGRSSWRVLAMSTSRSRLSQIQTGPTQSFSRLADGKLRRLPVAPPHQPVFSTAGTDQSVAEKQVPPAMGAEAQLVNGPPTANTAGRCSSTTTACSGGGGLNTGSCDPVISSITFAFPVCGRPKLK